ncbi:MAG: hypothetical protein JO165_13375 [Candidatus Eremiobacteraeota bacterium]|nr:hypothetical protein [Candidatus Eremiobacteraeota bacterium]
MRIFALALAAALITACSGGGVAPSAPQSYQASNASAPSSSSATVTISSAMLSSPPSYSNLQTHLLPVQTTGKPILASHMIRPKAIAYPDDMNYHGGAVLQRSVQHDIFVDCPGSCWGVPQRFQANLNLSSFVHVLDQYVGTTANDRYPVGTIFLVNQTFYTNMVSQNDLFTIIHAAAKVAGTGYGHTYHVFLKPGLDTCFDFGPCYSPDVPSQWTFCAYHGSLTYSDIGHVIFSVEPNQNVPGCGDVGISPLPNPVPIDSAATTLSHEFSESVSDPDVGSGWYNLFGQEIGDVCDVYRAYETLHGHPYIIQPEYSNAGHGCFY